MRYLVPGMVGILFAASTAATAATFNDRATFLAQSGTFVEHTDLTTDFNITGALSSSINTSYSLFTDKFAPNPYVVINDRENFDAVVTFASAVYGFGMDVYEPQASTLIFNGCNATCVESTFEITFLSMGSILDTITFEPDNEILDFIGYSNATAFDRIEIRETVGGIDNEMFGNFVTSTSPVSPVPLPAGLPLLVVALGAFGLARGGARN